MNTQFFLVREIFHDGFKIGDSIDPIDFDYCYLDIAKAVEKAIYLHEEDKKRPVRIPSLEGKEMRVQVITVEVPLSILTDVFCHYLAGTRADLPILKTNYVVTVPDDVSKLQEILS